MPCIETFKQDIEEWIVQFLSAQHEKLGGHTPCPHAFAAMARDNIAYTTIVSLEHLWSVLENINSVNFTDAEVHIIGMDPSLVTHQQLYHIREVYNLKWRPQGLVALDDHPTNVEEINGVRMNQGTYAMLLVQSREKLEKARGALKRSGYYDLWTEDQVKEMHEI